MSKIDKKIESMRRNPRNDWKIEDLDVVSRRHGGDYWHCGTSHVVFRFPHGLSLTVPARKPIKPIYIKKFVEILDSLRKEN